MLHTIKIAEEISLVPQDQQEACRLAFEDWKARREQLLGLYEGEAGGPLVGAVARDLAELGEAFVWDDEKVQPV